MNQTDRLQYIAAMTRILASSSVSRKIRRIVRNATPTMTATLAESILAKNARNDNAR